MDIGGKIKRLRLKTNLTQEELGNRCELSKGFISQVERNLTSPSIQTLKDILDSLGTNLKEFFSDAPDDKIVFKKDDVFMRSDDELLNNIYWLIPNAQKNKMEPIMLTLKESGRSQTYNPHEGEIFGFVIQGFVNVCLGENKFKVKKGESFYYKANATYFIENTAGSTAQVLWVSTPPAF